MIKFDPEKPMQTRDGRAARIICVDRMGAFPIMALIKSTSGCYEFFDTYTKNGTININRNLESELDLINIPSEPEETFIRISGSRVSGVFSSLPDHPMITKGAQFIKCKWHKRKVTSAELLEEKNNEKKD